MRNYLNFLQWDITKLCFEYDTEPYYQALDVKVKVSILLYKSSRASFHNQVLIVRGHGG